MNLSPCPNPFRIAAPIIIGAALAFIAGCTYYQPAMVSSSSINGDYERPVLVTYGEAHAFYLFGLVGPFGNDSLQAAIEDAMGDAPADTMTNVFVDRYITFFPLPGFSLVTRVYSFRQA